MSWTLPAFITVAFFSMSIWRISTVKSHGDYGFIGVNLAALVMFGADVIISLVAWLVWALVA